MMICGFWKNMLCAVFLLFYSASLTYGFTVRGVERNAITLPCTYTVKYAGDITTMCWGRGSCPNSQCNEPLIWTDGYKVTWRQSGRYELKGSIIKGDVSLTIHTASLQDQGDYCCRVEHKGWFNDKKLNMQLKVDRAPVTIRPRTVRTTTTTPPPIKTTTTEKLPTTVSTTIETDEETIVFITTPDDVKDPKMTTDMTPEATSTFPTSYRIIYNMDTEHEPRDSFSSDLPTHIPSEWSKPESTSLQEISTEEDFGTTANVWPTSQDDINTFEKDVSTISEPEFQTQDASLRPQPESTSLEDINTKVDSDTTAEVWTTKKAWVEVFTNNEVKGLITGAENTTDETSMLTSVLSPAPPTLIEDTVIDQVHRDTLNSGNSALQKANVTVEENKKKGQFPLYILITTISVSVIVLVLITLIVRKVRRKENGAYRFYCNPHLELVAHAENPMTELQEKATQLNEADTQNVL